MEPLLKLTMMKTIFGYLTVLLVKGRVVEKADHVRKAKKGLVITVLILPNYAAEIQQDHLIEAVVSKILIVMADFVS